MNDDVTRGMSLENVQSGDTLICHSNYGRSRRIVTVERTTKTQIVSGGGKFRKSNGGYVGADRWAACNVTVPKPNELEEVRDLQLHTKLVNQINDTCQLHLLRDMDLAKLKELNRVLEK
jgi:hypothetical protein